MTKQEFIDLFGQDPVDVLGQDWENELAENDTDDLGLTHEGHLIGNCFVCRHGL
jgi:hypothetical protein